MEDITYRETNAMRTKAKILFVVATLVAVALAGCTWLGYYAHVGTWDATYQDTDSLGDPVTVDEVLTMEMTSFVWGTTATYVDASQSVVGLRGDLSVIGHTFVFSENEISFDEDTMLVWAFLLALAGETFTLAGEEWMDIDAFVAEIQKADPTYTRELFAIGEAYFTLSGSALTLDSPDGSQTLEFTKR
jgi:hypothetical protein